MTKLARVPIFVAFIVLAWGKELPAQIPRPDDAPPALSPAESAHRFTLPDGFRMELVAAEPLVREPSGVCWTADGQLFVCELHGYNLEGQYDIEELNEAGQLDRIVRRIQAAEKHKQAAEEETYGTIKILRDVDGDGRMDRADVWADRLPPCFGICPARDGLIAACQTQVLFLADRDRDGTAEVREVLFDGFAKGPLERSINCPQWGPDNWIYLGSGAGGGRITGKYLKQPVDLPRTDFRIRPDGSAIEPVVGSTHTLGFTFAESGDRFVVSTRTPAIFVAPVDWRYLARNPHVPAPRLEEAALSDQRSWPTSRPHPWRTRRADDPDFAKYYSDRYGIQESAPNGYFTSACSPFVYRDQALPGLNGHLLACEPAQNLVFRGRLVRDGARLSVQRVEREAKAEFLTSSDPWFHAIALSHAPDGSIYIVDFYREIIEDYSAIPRYLQQQYGLIGGHDRGRIWRLTHERIAASSDAADMQQLTAHQLASEVGSSNFWRRQTARRLLDETAPFDVVDSLQPWLQPSSPPHAALNALATLAGLDQLSPHLLTVALEHPDADVRRRAIRLAEPFFAEDEAIRNLVLKRAHDSDARVRLQVALSLGAAHGDEVLETLATLAWHHAEEPWMTAAVLSSVPERMGPLLSHLLKDTTRQGRVEGLVKTLCQGIASRRDPGELTRTLAELAKAGPTHLVTAGLQGLAEGFPEPVRVVLDPAGHRALQKLMGHSEPQVRQLAVALLTRMKLETEEQRQRRQQSAVRDLADVTRPVETKLSAVASLADDPSPESTRVLLAALPSATPQVREAILQAVVSHRERVIPLLDALEEGTLPVSLLSGVQRAVLLSSDNPAWRSRATRLLKPAAADPRQMQPHQEALTQPRDVLRGQHVFREKCATCHQAHGIGHAVGPDLSAEFLRAEETIIQDVLYPSDKISSGFVAYSVTTASGKVLSGLLTNESPTSITLQQPEGKSVVVLRKDIESLRAMPVSLMPDDLAKTIPPRDLADALAWLRRPPDRLVLIDENQEFAAKLTDGGGTARFVRGDAARGELSLEITPLQRHASRIDGWEFRIRENPGPGEYRYLRFAWNAAAAQGAMIELVDDGGWPPADQPVRRYHAGRNTSDWQSIQVAADAPRTWTTVTRDLWKDFGEFTLTGIAPTALGGAVRFDQLELLKNPPAATEGPSDHK